MLKKVAVGLSVLLIVVLAILGYAVSIKAVNAFYFYILCFLALIAAVLFIILVLARNIIWKLLPENLKKIYETKRARFDAIIFFSILLFYIVAGAIDEFFLSKAPSFISLLVNTTTFVFVAFLALSLIRRGKVKTIVAGSVVFILLIALLLFFCSTTLKSGEVTQSSPIGGLNTLPYVSWISAEENIEKTGVTQYDPELAFDGLNLYSSEILPEARLIDMYGNIVHKWTKKIKGANAWYHAEICKNGDLLVLVSGRALIRLDWDSNVKWKKKMHVHHDFYIDKSEKIHVLTNKGEVVFWHGIPAPVETDYIVVLSTDGQIEKEISIYDAVKELVPLRRAIKIHKGLLRFFEPKNVLKCFMLKFRECRYDMLRDEYHDILHTNTVEVIDRDIEGFCRKGDWLISIRQLDLIGVVDAKEKKLVWSWGPGELNRQHHPTLLENGNILVFDNGNIRGFSRIVELNPLTKKIVWEYKSKPPEKFFSTNRGGNQRLPNGNTLITETTKGRVFEVTKDGKVVWEFYNPDVNTEDKKRAVIYRMMRITNPERYRLRM